MYQTDVHVVVGHLGYGLDDRCRALVVCTLCRGDTIGQRCPCLTSISGCACQLTKRCVVGDGQGSVGQSGVQSLVFLVLSLSEVDDVVAEPVSIVIVITIFRASQAVFLNLFVTDEVSLQSFIQLIQSVLLVVEYQLLDCCHGVSIGCQTGPYNARTEVVHCAAGLNALAVFHTTFEHDGHQWLRRQFSVDSLGDNRHNGCPLGHVSDGRLDRILELIKCLVVAEVAQIRCDLLAVPERNTVVQCQLDSDRPLCVGCGCPLIQSSCLLRLYAAHQAVVSGILYVDALGQHHLDMCIVEVASRESHSCSYDVYDLLHILLR